MNSSPSEQLIDLFNKRVGEKQPVLQEGNRARMMPVWFDFNLELYRETFQSKTVEMSNLGKVVLPLVLIM